MTKTIGQDENGRIGLSSCTCCCSAVCSTRLSSASRTSSGKLVEGISFSHIACDQTRRKGVFTRGPKVCFYRGKHQHWRIRLLRIGLRGSKWVVRKRMSRGMYYGSHEPVWCWGSKWSRNGWRSNIGVKRRGCRRTVRDILFAMLHLVASFVVHSQQYHIS